MSADTLTADGAAAVLPGLDSPGSQTPVTYTTVSGADEVAVAYRVGGLIEVTGYDLAGNQVFSGLGAGNGDMTSVQNFSLAPAGGVGFVMTIDTMYIIPQGVNYSGGYQLFNAAGQATVRGGEASAFGLTAFSAPDGAHLEWNTAGGVFGQPSSYTFTAQDVASDGTPGPTTTGSSSSTPQEILPYASTAVGSLGALVISDNQAHFATQAAVTLPGEPAHAVTDVAAAGLAGGTTAAVAWADSGTDYVSIFNVATNSFGPVTGLDWGGASDVHVVDLPDGGFAVSWMNGGAYKGELFDASGAGGGVIALAGDVAGIDSHGDLYTVGLNSNGQYQVQTYAINGSGGGGGGGGSGSEVYTSDATYTAPAGVTIIHLTGSNQTVTANNAGDTIWSDNTVNHLIGGTGDDVFHIGRGGDIVTGGGGNDTFSYAELPWNPGQITDFGVGDVIDLTGLLRQVGYDGNDPVGAHYLDIAPTIQGAELQVFALGQFWNVGFVDGVAASDLQVNGDLITLSASGAGGPVTTSASSYTAPANVTSISLTGSQQTIDASATANGVTINSNDTGNTLTGGSGNDVFHLGRGGDVVTGGAGADDFMYAQTPWAGGTITDFNAAQGDRIDVVGLLQASSYAGSDPLADGYLKFAADANGNAQIWSDIHAPGNDGWWLVATLDGVSTSSLHYSNGLIT